MDLEHAIVFLWQGWNNTGKFDVPLPPWINVDSVKKKEL